MQALSPSANVLSCRMADGIGALLVAFLGLAGDLLRVQLPDARIDATSLVLGMKPFSTCQ
jgi:hypothetical protein